MTVGCSVTPSPEATRRLDGGVTPRAAQTEGGSGLGRHRGAGGRRCSEQGVPRCMETCVHTRTHTHAYTYLKESVEGRKVAKNSRLWNSFDSRRSPQPGHGSHRPLVRAANLV